MPAQPAPKKKFPTALIVIIVLLVLAVIAIPVVLIGGGALAYFTLTPKAERAQTQQAPEPIAEGPVDNIVKKEDVEKEKAKQLPPKDLDPFITKEPDKQPEPKDDPKKPPITDTTPKDPPVKDPPVKDPPAKDPPAKDPEPSKDPEPVGDPGPNGIRPAPLKAEREDRNLPGVVSDVVVGGSGRFIIYQIPEHRQLAIFDVNEAKVVKFLPLAEAEAKVAAGADKLIIYLPDANLLQRYDLKTFEREASVVSTAKAPLNKMLMGSASQGPLYLCPKDPGFGKPAIVLFDPATLKELPRQPEVKGLLLFGISPTVARVSGDGRLVTTYSPGTSPQGHTIVAGTGNELKTANLTGDVAGRMSPGAEGRFIYTARGIFTSEGKPVGKMGGYGDGSRYCLPAAEGEALYLRIDVPGFPHGDGKKTGTLYLHTQGEERPIAALPDVPLPKGTNTWGREAFLTDQYLHLIPSAQLLVALAPTKDKLHLFKVDVDQLLAKADYDYLLVLSRPPVSAVRGEEFVYKPVVKSKKGSVKLRVESGPEGMSVDDKGQLTWKVPAKLADKEVTVIASVGDAGGQEVFHNFRLSIRGALAKETEPAPKVTKEVPAPAAKDPVVVKLDRNATHIASNADGTLLAVAIPGAQPGDRNIRLLQLPSGKEKARIKTPDHVIEAIALLGDGKSVLAGGRNEAFFAANDPQHIRNYDVATGNPIKAFSGFKGNPHPVVFSGDGALVAGGEDATKTIRVLDAKTGKPRQAIDKTHKQKIHRLAFTPDGKYVVSAGIDAATSELKSKVIVWDLATGKDRRVIEGIVGEVKGLAVSTDGTRIAAAINNAGVSGSVRVWDLESGDETLAVEGKPAHRVVFGPGGKSVIAAHNDNVIRLYDLATKKATLELEGHTSLPEALTLTRDGKTLISAGLDKTIRIWDCTEEFTRVNGEPNAKGDGSDQAKTAAAKVDFSLKASELATEFAKDRDAATKKYTGKVIEFTGALHEVAHFGVDKKFGVVIFGGNFSGIHYLLNVIIQPAEAERVFRMSKGQTLKVVASCTGCFGRYIGFEGGALTEVSKSAIVELSAEDLAAEFAKDRAAAETRFLKKTVLVSGMVEQIQKGKEGGMTALLKSGSNLKVRVYSNAFGSAEVDKLGANKAACIRVDEVRFDADRGEICLREIAVTKAK